MRSQRNFTSEQYVHLFENKIIPYSEENFPDSDLYILQDNSWIHTSFQTTAYLALRLGVDRFIPHAPKSPDYNPIENFFGILSKEIRRNPLIFNNRNQLWAAIQNCWTGIDIQMCQTLADSMPQRYNEVLAKNGSTIHYWYHFLNT